jgi:hypothetical protein
VTSVSGVVLLSSFRNIDKKRRAFEGFSMVGKRRKDLLKKGSLFLLARRPALFNRIQRAMWLWWPKENSEKPLN